MPIELTNAPSSFQCIIANLFSNLLRKLIKVIVDEIIIHSMSIEDYVQHLDIILACLKGYSCYRSKSFYKAILPILAMK